MFSVQSREGFRLSNVTNLGVSSARKWPKVLDRNLPGSTMTHIDSMHLGAYASRKKDALYIPLVCRVLVHESIDAAKDG